MPQPKLRREVRALLRGRCSRPATTSTASLLSAGRRRTSTLIIYHIGLTICNSVSARPGSKARAVGPGNEIGVATVEPGRQPGNWVFVQPRAKPPVPYHRMGVGEYVVGVREPDASGVDNRE